VKKLTVLLLLIGLLFGAVGWLFKQSQEAGYSKRRGGSGRAKWSEPESDTLRR
jgi:hypothetical protein